MEPSALAMPGKRYGPATPVLARHGPDVRADAVEGTIARPGSSEHRKEGKRVWRLFF